MQWFWNRFILILTPLSGVAGGLPPPTKPLTAVCWAREQALLSPYSPFLDTPVYYTFGGCLWKKLARPLPLSPLLSDYPLKEEHCNIRTLKLILYLVQKDVVNVFFSLYLEIGRQIFRQNLEKSLKNCQRTWTTFPWSVVLFRIKILQPPHGEYSY